MNCNEFESTLNECLDDREDPRLHSELQAHAVECRNCESSLEIYAAIGEFGEVSLPGSIAHKRRVSGYWTAVAAAALLFLLLNPLGNFFSDRSEHVNLAHASGSAMGDVESHRSQQGTETVQPNGSSKFWQDRRFASVVPIEQFAFAVPQPPNLQEMGRSINSVWKSIQEDEFLIPIIKQGALFWIPR